MLMLLMVVWGALSLFVVPWEPFWVPNVAQMIVGAVALVYFVRTWNRPNRRVADGISAAAFSYALLLLPWTALKWCALGRPLEAFTVPHVGVICVALVFPGGLVPGLAVMGAFVAESLFAFFYARHVGLGELVPMNEPLASLAIATFGVGLLFLRRQRRNLVHQYIHVQGEIEALGRVRPLFAEARAQLESELAVLTAAAHPGSAEQACGFSPSMSNAVDRLGDLRVKLGRLVATEEGIPSPPEAEQRLLARDAQLGAVTLAGLGALVGAPMIPWSHAYLGRTSTLMSLVLTFVYVVALIHLVSTRRQPSVRRALWMFLILYATALFLVSYNQAYLLVAHRPYVPFLGHKLLMVALGLTLTSRFELGVILIILTAIDAVAIWFGLRLGAHRDIVSVAEPWVTLVFMLVGLVSLRMVEQRRIASIRLLRAEAQASALHRRALMFMALRDRLNSPLQVLVLGASATPSRSPEAIERLRAAIARLVALSRELAKIDMPQPSASAWLDADRELSRHA
jgi:hypothetical protein